MFGICLGDYTIAPGTEIPVKKISTSRYKAKTPSADWSSACSTITTLRMLFPLPSAAPISGRKGGLPGELCSLLSAPCSPLTIHSTFPISPFFPLRVIMFPRRQGPRATSAPFEDTRHE
jgi:hypothetical protein